MNDIVFNAYEVGTIINENRRTICATHNLSIAQAAYVIEVEKAKRSNDYVIVFLYDYNKNTNIEYYDSEAELC